MEDDMIKILVISGSLRKNSSSNAIIGQVVSMGFPGVEFIVYNGLGLLPHFNDAEIVSAYVSDFRKLITESDGVFFCTPEYAFGVPGTLKNSLDWLVSSGELTYKPVAVITAATNGEKAHASLLYTLTAISASIAERGTLLISFIRSKMNEKNEIKDPATLSEVKSVITALITEIESKN